MQQHNFTSVTALALSLMTAAFGLSLIIGLIYFGGYITGALKVESLLSGSVPPLYGVLSCINPLVNLLELLALVMLAYDGAQVSPLHRRLTRLALGLFISEFLLLLASSGLSIAFTQSGSLFLAQAGYVIQILMLTVEIVAVGLALAALCSKGQRAVLLASMLLSWGSGMASLLMVIASLKVQTLITLNVRSHVALPQMDFQTGLSPLFSGLSLLGMLGFLVLGFQMAVQAWRVIRERDPIVDAAE